MPTAKTEYQDFIVCQDGFVLGQYRFAGNPVKATPTQAKYLKHKLMTPAEWKDHQAKQKTPAKPAKGKAAE